MDDHVVHVRARGEQRARRHARAAGHGQQQAPARNGRTTERQPGSKHCQPGRRHRTAAGQHRDRDARLSDLERGPNVFRVRASEIVSELSTLIEVDAASAVVKLPADVSVRLDERDPEAARDEGRPAEPEPRDRSGGRLAEARAVLEDRRRFGGRVRGRQGPAGPGHGAPGPGSGRTAARADFLGRGRELSLSPGNLLAVRGAGAYRALMALGLTDAIALTAPEPGSYTFWDYQAGAWQKDNGIRIDHLLLSPEAAGRLQSAAIDKHVRAWEKPSDHVPVVIGYAA